MSLGKASSWASYRQRGKLDSAPTNAVEAYAGPFDVSSHLFENVDDEMASIGISLPTSGLDLSQPLPLPVAILIVVILMAVVVRHLAHLLDWRHEIYFRWDEEMAIIPTATDEESRKDV